MRAVRLSLFFLLATPLSALAQPKIQVMPNPVDCGGVAPGGQAMPVTVTIANVGNQPLTVGANGMGPTVGGTNPGEFIPDTMGIPYPVQLGPGTSVPMTITFAPAMNAMGNRSAILFIPHNDNSAMNPLQIPLRGVAGYPQIQLGSLSVAFGNQRVGVASTPQAITVTNPGGGDLRITALTAGGGNAADFSSPTMLPITIKPMQMGTFSIVFKPGALGFRSGTISVVSNGNNGNQRTDNISVFGTGTSATLACTPNMIDFGNQRVFVASTPKTYTCTNSGNDAANITGIRFTGAAGQSFALSSPPSFPARVNGNMGSITFNVVAVPLALGPGMAQLVVDNDNNQPNISSNLTVTGVGAQIKVTPNYADFGPVAVLQTSSPQMITISNEGTDVLTINSFQVTGMDAVTFTVNNPPKPPIMIQPKGTISFDVVFKPVVAMVHTAAIDMTTDDPQAKLLKIPLAGVGASSGVMLSRMSIPFGMIPLGTIGGPQTLDINNTGDAPLTITAISLGGANPGSFMVDQMAPLQIDGMKSQRLNITFSPITAGNHTASLSITPKGAAPLAVSLTGTAVAPQLGVGPTELDFGPIVVNTTSEAQPVNLKNGGNTGITLGTIASSDPAFIIDMTGTNLNLGPMGQTSFGVKFMPTKAEAKSGVVAITLKGQNTPIQMVKVMGSGIERAVTPRRGGCDLGARGGAGPWPLVALLIGGLGAALVLSRLGRPARRR